MKASNNSILDGTTGKLGRKVVARESFGETVISTPSGGKIAVSATDLADNVTTQTVTH